jgi:hypothetical protein
MQDSPLTALSQSCQAQVLRQVGRDLFSPDPFNDLEWLAR